MSSLANLDGFCSCPDATFRRVKCKHVWAIEFSLALRQEVESSVTLIQPVNAQNCSHYNSSNFVKHGPRHNKYRDLRRFLSRDCGKRFVVNLGFEKMQATPQAITGAMQLYFTGESFRNVQKFLRLQGVNMNHVTVYEWVGICIKLMKGYLEKITPQLGDNWRTDEMYVKIQGNMKYLFAMMDDETRFRISQMVAEHKGTSDVQPMFREAREKAGKKPEVLISDGAANFYRAYNKEYWTHFNPRPVHIQEIRMSGKVHNNKMERQNGEVGDREKVIRGLKKDDSPVIDGIQVFHNYFRPHEGLDGKTPAEAAGIKIEGENPWITVIQNAKRSSGLSH
jgi:transposase-like protein